MTTHSPFTIVLFFTWETRSLHFMMQFLSLTGLFRKNRLSTGNPLMGSGFPAFMPGFVPAARLHWSGGGAARESGMPRRVIIYLEVIRRLPEVFRYYRIG